MLYFQKQGVHGIYLYNLTNKQLSEGKKTAFATDQAYLQ